MVDDIYNAAHDKNGMKIYNAVVKIMKQDYCLLQEHAFTSLMLRNYVKNFDANTLLAKSMKYLKITMVTLVLDILICWKWFGTSHKQVLWL